MNNYEEGQIYSFDVQALCESEENLTFGRVITENDEHGNLNYYDLYTNEGELFCCDGEEVRVEQVGKELITFVSDNGEYIVRFTAHRDEADIACNGGVIDVDGF